MPSTSDEDERLARQLRDAVARLNEAVSAAASAGLSVDVEVGMIERLGDPAARPVLQLRIARPL